MSLQPVIAFHRHRLAQALEALEREYRDHRSGCYRCLFEAPCTPVVAAVEDLLEAYAAWRVFRAHEARRRARREVAEP